MTGTPWPPGGGGRTTIGGGGRGAVAKNSLTPYANFEGCDSDMGMPRIRAEMPSGGVLIAERCQSSRRAFWPSAGAWRGVLSPYPPLISFFFCGLFVDSLRQSRNVLTD
jgi:hypothetical protein